jgi:isopenicillin N synthase-like dioxygenase
MIPYRTPKAVDQVPVIDLTGSFCDNQTKRSAVALAVREVARDIGFFYIKGHRVPDALMHDQLEWARRFFSLPTEAKMAIDIRKSTIMRGYEPMALQTLDQGSPPDLKESLQLGRHLAPEHPVVRRLTPFEGPNQWPRDLPGFPEQMTRYMDAMIALGRHLATCIALSLDLREDYFAPGLEEPGRNIRLLRYPPQTAIRNNQLGCGAHTDWGFITILLQSGVGGLEVCNTSGEWIIAPPLPGCFVVNLGDLIPRLTNGLYRSTPHRVLNNVSGRDRYSVPTFFNPDYSYRFHCVPTCRADETSPDAGCTFGEHVEEMVYRTYAWR